MKFVDEATISVTSGNGGAGCVSFRREKFIPKGGPDGGDGGRGGDVILLADGRKRTLYDLRFKRLFKAENGRPGQGSQKSGRNGKDAVLSLPPGTLVRDADTDAVLADLKIPDERFIVAKGGRGGKGNRHFATSTHQAPRFAQPGEEGEVRNLRLELKLLADVGLVGMPNAGKSTLISVISAATPKIADYPFTTLTPHLGVVRVDWGEPFVVADIPGLIEGAHAGAGLGIRFLRHIERTRVLVHLIDAGALNPDDPLADYAMIRRELIRYSPLLGEKPTLVVLNKMDLPGAPMLADRFEAAARSADGEDGLYADMDEEDRPPILRISAATGDGLTALKSHITRILDLMAPKGPDAPGADNGGPNRPDNE